MKQEPMKNHLDSNEKFDLSNKSSEIDDKRQRMQDSLMKTNNYKMDIRYESSKTDPQSLESLSSNIKKNWLKGYYSY